MPEFQHTPAEIVQQALIDLAAAGDPDSDPLDSWPVYSLKEPGEPDNVLTVYNTTPQQDGRVMPTGVQVLHYGIMVRVRTDDESAGWVKATAVRMALDTEVRNLIVGIGTARYLLRNINRTNLLDAGDEVPATRRSIFTINGLASIRVLA